MLSDQDIEIGSEEPVAQNINDLQAYLHRKQELFDKDMSATTKDQQVTTAASSQVQLVLSHDSEINQITNRQKEDEEISHNTKHRCTKCKKCGFLIFESFENESQKLDCLPRIRKVLDTRRWFKCFLCEKIFLEFLSLRNHLKLHHEIQPSSVEYSRDEPKKNNNQNEIEKLLPECCTGEVATADALRNHLKLDHEIQTSSVEYPRDEPKKNNNQNEIEKLLRECFTDKVATSDASLYHDYTRKLQCLKCFREVSNTAQQKKFHVLCHSKEETCKKGLFYCLMCPPKHYSLIYVAMYYNTLKCHFKARHPNVEMELGVNYVEIKQHVYDSQVQSQTCSKDQQQAPLCNKDETTADQALFSKEYVSPIDTFAQTGKSVSATVSSQFNVIKCSKCGKSGIDSDNFKQLHCWHHFSQEHDLGKVFKCLQCNKSYSTLGFMMSHLQTKHEGEGQHQTEIATKLHYSLGVNYVIEPASEMAQHINSLMKECFSGPYKTMNVLSGFGVKKSAGSTTYNASKQVQPIRQLCRYKSLSPIDAEFFSKREFYRTQNVRPLYSYMSLIRQAIIESNDKQLTLHGIYNWFQDSFAYFRWNVYMWKNSIRSCLYSQSHKCFTQVKSINGAIVWTVDEAEFSKYNPQQLCTTDNSHSNTSGNTDYQSDSLSRKMPLGSTSIGISSILDFAEGHSMSINKDDVKNDDCCKVMLSLSDSEAVHRKDNEILCSTNEEMMDDVKSNIFVNKNLSVMDKNQFVQELSLHMQESSESNLDLETPKIDELVQWVTTFVGQIPPDRTIDTTCHLELAKPDVPVDCFFETKDSFSATVTASSQLNLIKCNECGKTVKDIQKFKLLHCWHHLGEKLELGEVFKCLHCEKSCSTLELITYHLQANHKTESLCEVGADADSQFSQSVNYIIDSTNDMLQQIDSLMVACFSSTVKISNNTMSNPRTVKPTPRRLAKSLFPIDAKLARKRKYFETHDVRPLYTYVSLIRQAITESEDKQLTLNGIYEWFEDTFAYYRHSTDNWKNSVRHNLCLHKGFKRMKCPNGAYVWVVDEGVFCKLPPKRLSAASLHSRRLDDGHQSGSTYRLENLLESTSIGGSCNNAVDSVLQLTDDQSLQTNGDGNDDDHSKFDFSLSDIEARRRHECILHSTEELFEETKLNSLTKNYSSLLNQNQFMQDLSSPIQNSSEGNGKGQKVDGLVQQTDFGGRIPLYRKVDSKIPRSPHLRSPHITKPNSSFDSFSQAESSVTEQNTVVVQLVQQTQI